MSVLKTMSSTQHLPDGWMRTIWLTRLQAYNLYHELSDIDHAPTDTVEEFLALPWLKVGFDDGMAKVMWQQPRELV